MLDAKVQETKCWNALVVGGEESFVMSKLSKSLQKHGIRVAQHLDWTLSRPPRRLAPAIDLVYICTDMVGHNLSEPCMNLARDADIPYVNGTRKWAESVARLTQAGFPLLPLTTKLAASQVEIVEEVPTPETTTETQQQEEEAAPTAEIEQTSVTSSSNQQESTMPEATSKPIRHDLAISNPKQILYINALIHTPYMSNKEVWEAVREKPELAGCKFDPNRAAHARCQLGITTIRRGGNRIVTIDRNEFLRTAIEVGANDCVIPNTEYVVLSSGGPPDGVQQEKKVDAVAAAPASTQDVEPIQHPVDPFQTNPIARLREAVRELQAAMRDVNYIEVVVTEREVKFKQVQVVEGSFTL